MHLLLNHIEEEYTEELQRWTSLMDDYLDQYLASSSWSDVSALDQSHALHGNPQAELENGAKLVPVGATSGLRYDVDRLASQDGTTAVIGNGSDYGVSVNRQVKNENMDEYASSVPDTGSFPVVLPLSSDSSPTNPSSSKQLPMIDDVASFLNTKTGSCGCNSPQLSDIQRSLIYFSSLSTVPPISPTSFDAVSLLSYAKEADKLDTSGLQGGGVDDNVGSKYTEMNNLLHFNNFSASESGKGAHLHPLPSFASKPLVTGQVADVPSLLQTKPVDPTASGNETAKPRVRARRGQATDPHSIAERLRREKISERMKSLQELVPCPSKTDKASMLDEIIEYVKFLQLQVKALSTGRLGVAGAAVPVITHNHSEGSRGLSPSSSGGQGIELPPTAEQIAFQQEVLKLMEANASMVVNYLQSEGLRLMPAALATAILDAKRAQARASSDERDKSNSAGNGAIHNNSSSSSNSGLA